MSAVALRSRPAPGRSPWLWGPGVAAAAIALGAAASLSPAGALGGLIVLVVTYAVVRRPYVGVAILVALTPVVSAMKRGLIVPGLRPSEALVAWLAPVVILVARRPVPRWGPLEWLGIAYAAASFLLGSFDVWQRGDHFTSSNLGTMLGPVQYLLLLRAVRVGVRSARERDGVLSTLILAAVPISLLALAQGFGIHPAQRIGVSATGLDLGHLDRATALFANWQVLAGYLLAVGMLSSAVVAFRAERVLPARLAYPILIVIVAALARTLTIGALVGWIAGTVALVALAGRVRLSGGRLAAVLATALVLFSAVLAARSQQQFHAHTGGASTGIVPRTLIDRYNIWAHQYIPALSGRWVTGYGPGIPTDVAWKFTESVYVTMVLRGGLILLGIYGFLSAGFVAVARRATTASAEARALRATVITLVLVLVPLQLIATYFTTSGLPEVLWILAGLLSVPAIRWGPAVPRP
jgi:hypothetical protein